MFLAIVLSLGFVSKSMAIAAGQISGTVTSQAGGKPIEGIEVCAFSLHGEASGCETTGVGGAYTIAELPVDEYDVEFSSPSGSGLNYVFQYYNGASSLAGAQPVLVTAGVTASGIDAKLEEGGQLLGTVTTATPGKTTIEGIEVCAFRVGGGFEGGGCAKTGAKGQYTVSGLVSGKYQVEFFAPFASGLNYLTQYYNKKQSLSEAEAVPVTAPSTVHGIDAELEEGGSISGRVTDAASAVALESVVVCASRVGGEMAQQECAFTGFNGEYTIVGLANGEYNVRFDDGQGYLVQYYNGKSSLSEAQAITVTAPNVVSGVDAAMQPASTLPVNTTAPVVSGVPAVGGLLVCADGTWTGTPAPTLTEQWLRDGTPIQNAIGSGYAVQAADAGHTISCRVTAKNTKGESSATSTEVAIPPPATPPSPVIRKPVVTVGSKIAVSGGSLKLLVKCAGAQCRGSIELTVKVLVRHRKGGKTVSRKETLVLAKGSFSIAEGKSANIRLRLTHAGKKRLARAKRHPVVAELVLSVAGERAITKSVLVR